jgi:hypothetical protein
VERLCSVWERIGAERKGAERVCSDEGISDALVNSTNRYECKRTGYWALFQWIKAVAGHVR